MPTVAHRWAQEILLCSPLAVRYTKELALASLEGAAWTTEQVELRRQLWEKLMDLDDTREGITAFAAKRTPRWVGH
jgi:enoyl-CoA hydratase/carnithine racemase